VFEELKKRDRLFATERYVHRYPHCWRCKTELLYRLVDEWFINMGPRNTEEGFRGDIMKVVQQVNFLPESLNGRAREYDWLWNMGDWMISKKRYWGLALPIWVDDQDPTQFEVIGSRDELKERAVEGWQEFDGHTPHRPFVDKVKIRNPRTGNLMSRVPDVGNPWLDAGIVAYSTMPEDWRPAKFITESFPGQFRNWFYALLAMSTMMNDGEPPFENLLGFATMRDQEGKEMHKSEGNSIEFISAADEGFVLVHKLKEKAKAEKPDGALGFTEIEVFDKELGKPVKAIRAAYPPIGADVMRWMYCRQDPTKNMNFGPVPANEVRNAFHIKLWHCYGLLVNYARLDGFDPTSELVKLQDRPDIDRWIVSDLQGLIRTANNSFEKFDVATFCLEAEKFVDDRLSNWYVRRNRDRFWSKNAELDEAGKRDKLAAYQTMYEVLTTLCKLIAPVVPFLAETMWQNLRKSNDAESVHLTSFPIPELSATDFDLSLDMNALLRIVSLGRAARNAAKINVRQPLAELRVAPGYDGDSRAVKRFTEQIRDELNIKAVSLVDGPMLSVSVKLNKKTANAKLGPKGKDADAALAALDAAIVAGELRSAGKFTLLDVELAAADFLVEFVAPAGWVGVADKGTQVMLDTRLTPELKAEGTARDVVRFVQGTRKDAGLDVADKIALYLGTTAEPLRSAIAAHRDTIAGETQVIAWLDAPPADGFTAADKKVDGHPLTIALRKV
jgi:isoleucyl-tRNA synthetase